MAEIFSRDELDQCSKEVLITLFLNLQEQMIEMNGKLDRLAEQLAVARITGMAGSLKNWM